MNNKGKGLLALLGVAAGAFAFWKYKNMSDDEKARLKGKVNNVGQKIKEGAQDVERSLTDKYEELKGKAKAEAHDATS
ncbi:hypothetical protein [Altibacter lentus]|uniref:hypothetical protein n=1 Tax=Altibacter lentus TaxID=1223410 RepID=UPI0005583BFC|nr:hypothetical protein [Altibacter lentus]